jgi:hypothetical protein
MNLEVELQTLNFQDLMEAVPPYQRDQFLAATEGVDVSPQVAEAMAASWLNAEPAVTRQFGGAGSSKPLFHLFVAELHAFLCTNDARYANERKALAAQLDWSNKKAAVSALITSLAGVVGAKLGVVAGLLVGPCALLLFVIARMGQTAWCKLISAQQTPPPANADAQRA